MTDFNMIEKLYLYREAASSTGDRVWQDWEDSDWPGPDQWRYLRASGFLKPSFTWPLSFIYGTQFQTLKNVLKTYESIIVS